MRKLIMGVLFGLAIAASFASSALAQGHAIDHARGGLGFRSSDAPIGIRWWLSDMIGVDAGVGYTSEKIAGIGTDPVTGNPTDETFTSFSADVGVPIRLKSWENVHFLFRPGFTYTSADDISFFLATDLKEKRNDYSVTGELEVEFFMAKNASISASHGFGFASSKLDVSGSDADTIFGTFGSNFTTLGFHVYLWAPAAASAGE